MSSPRRLDPTNDYVFKLLFSSPDSSPALRSLVEAVLQPKVPIDTIRVLNPILPGEDLDDHSVILDLSLKLKDGTSVDLEMQAKGHKAFRERALYYWAKLYTRKLRRGRNYDKLTKTVSVLFLGYDEFKGERFHSTFKPQEIHTREVFSDAMEIHTIELQKLPEPPSPSSGPEGEAELVAWSRFFKASSEEEMRRIAEGHPGMVRATEILDRLSEDEQVRELARRRELALVTRNIIADGGYREGMKKGEAKGRREGKKEGRKLGKAEGLAQGRRDTIRIVCELRGIPLSADREAWLESAALPELEARLEVLKRDGVWPG